MPEPCRSPAEAGAYQRILVRANNWIGDVVMMSPAVRALRRRFPRAEITMVAKPWVVEALNGSPLFDRLLPFDRGGRHAGITGFLRMARTLRTLRFDLAVLFQNAFEAALLTALARIPVRLGFATDGRRWLLTEPALRPPAYPVRHRGEEFLDLVEHLGCQRDPGPPEFPLPAGTGPAAAGRPRVAIHPGSSKPPRGWHPERFATVAAALQRRFDADILLLGNRAEAALLDTIAAQLERPPQRLADGAGVREMAEELLRCRLFIGNDSGPMHMAGALGLPVVALFGPSHPERTGPFRPRRPFVPIFAAYPCAPCRQRFFTECDPAATGKPPCLEAIGPEPVLEAAGRLLDEAGRSVSD